jgi:hypothetical protein
MTKWTRGEGTQHLSLVVVYKPPGGSFILVEKSIPDSTPRLTILFVFFLPIFVSHSICQFVSLGLPAFQYWFIRLTGIKEIKREIEKRVAINTL